MDRGAWLATVQGIAKSWIWLSAHTHFQLSEDNNWPLFLVMIGYKNQINAFTLNNQKMWQNMWNNNFKTLDNRNHKNIIPEKGKKRESLFPGGSLQVIAQYNVQYTNHVDFTELRRQKSEFRKVKEIRIHATELSEEGSSPRKSSGSAEGSPWVLGWGPIYTAMEGKQAYNHKETWDNHNKETFYNIKHLYFFKDSRSGQ